MNAKIAACWEREPGTNGGDCDGCSSCRWSIRQAPKLYPKRAKAPVRLKWESAACAVKGGCAARSPECRAAGITSHGDALWHLRRLAARGVAVSTPESHSTPVSAADVTGKGKRGYGK